MGISSEIYNRPLHWEVEDTFIYPDNHRERVRDIDYNIVVNNCGILIASLMKGTSGYTGVKYWANGSGLGTWSNSEPPAPTESDATLVTEIYRKAIAASDIKFIDNNNLTSATPTNRIEITVVFAEGESNGELREFAIFGGNASSTAGSGLMINHKTHPLIYKTSSLKLERKLRLTF